jgi:hypothetical protein
MNMEQTEKGLRSRRAPMLVQSDVLETDAGLETFIGQPVLSARCRLGEEDA